MESAPLSAAAPLPATLCLTNRRQTDFGVAGVDALAQPAMAKAVEKINQQTDDQPNEETHPSFDWQAEHERAAKENAEQGKDGDERHPKWPRPGRIFAPQDDHPQANENESEERSYVR
jgi:hypothetical protein